MTPAKRRRTEEAEEVDGNLASGEGVDVRLQRPSTPIRLASGSPQMHDSNSFNALNSDSKTGKDRVSILLSAVANLFNHADFSDVTIFVGTFELPAHSFVLMSQSEHFKGEIKRKLEEDNEQTFWFDDDDYELQTYWRVFEYMYKGTYSDECPKGISGKEKCKTILDRCLTPEFLDGVDYLYCHLHPTNTMRQLFVQRACENFDTLDEMDGFEGFVHENVDFAVDMARNLYEMHMSSKPRTPCALCGASCEHEDKSI
ncbi:hypothetical protein PT974_07123 [Cladobotryum mycophilum]|uniref:BTB domain-containing protein n=1 Tax=Cladobotryum mycophilum TaxID=491253 RepID=A0ABR0SNG2_9HYPO